MPEVAALPSKRLEALRARTHAPGVASFFYFDAHFGRDAVKLLPGEYFAHDNDVLLMTTLGSCIAACLWDARAQVGGMNHFMLPEGGGSDAALEASGRYGSYAMELLINDLMKRGATRATLEAKIFGGAQVISGMDSLNIGEANTAFVLDYLTAERIPIVASDVLGNVARKVCFIPGSGKAMVKRLACAPDAAIFGRDRAAARQGTPASAGGSVDLF